MVLVLLSVSSDEKKELYGLAVVKSPNGNYYERARLFKFGCRKPDLYATNSSTASNDTR
jgi:hypothetical protein